MTSCKETLISKDLMYLFNKGENYRCYNILGAHKRDGGYLFSVWAPNAAAVSVVGSFNSWSCEADKMELFADFGIWYKLVPNVSEGETYKFCIKTRDGETLYKADPFAFESQIRPDTASVTTDTAFNWEDKRWLLEREKNPPYDRPINIYEVHFGSWKRHSDGSLLSYREMADELIPYVREQGYTHIELLPICEYPFDGSWGYQVTGYYSANSRYGSPSELKYFINQCHKAGIGVLMDWVPAHFPRDAHGLARFDGTPLYEHPDSRLGEHKEWGTLVFNWQKTEIHSFLISNAMYWLEEFHFDGIRVDAVSSMLYLDYNRKDGEWVRNKYGGNENIYAIEFLQKLNTEVFAHYPGIMMIAEESTAWANVTKPVSCGGLGFNFKWNMGWMNDILTYMGMDPYFRGSNHNMLTFSMMYAYSENYILPLSHDEVVHGKKSLIDKMYGTYEQKFKSLKLLYLYMYAHPGKKLLFMGGEFGQFIEWRFAEGLDWLLLDYDTHRGLSNFTKDLNLYYKSHKALYENDSDWGGFEWINEKDGENSVISFRRISRSGREKITCVFNFAAKEHKAYEIGVKSAGTYKAVLNTDERFYGGASERVSLKAKAVKNKPYRYAIYADLPELSGMYIEKVHERKNSKDKK